MTEAPKHPLLAHPEEARIAYLSLLAELCFIDRIFDEQERKHLDTELSKLDISDQGKARVYAAVYDLKDSHREAILAGIKALGSSDLRFTLISDLFLMSLANGYISVEEQEHVIRLGRHLELKDDQIQAIKQVQFNLWQIRNTPSDSDSFNNLIKECAASLAGVGVPVAAVAASGSVFGLSAAGITSGLAALGALVGGGMLAGTVLVVPVIAAGSIWGVKVLVDLIAKDN
ncbi:TerB family tellurite resistance protein [Cyanobium sp. ATX 6F1]|uniref:tellurite resistance TerB family protein n=1 Tax=unclassified Cyanobium TaxID=2627006 RepID=UPI0020CC8F8A|nr:TerB family tellurite resistance protein [Cyanobium sp. ATX 6F1]MCP9916322.1 TerB family tellurite resistance protein [Cyanobium sp. ATX 6F1]